MVGNRRYPAARLLLLALAACILSSFSISPAAAAAASTTTAAARSSSSRLGTAATAVTTSAAANIGAIAGSTTSSSALRTPQELPAKAEESVGQSISSGEISSTSARVSTRIVGGIEAPCGATPWVTAIAGANSSGTLFRFGCGGAAAAGRRARDGQQEGII